jgi:hypothetical protein
VYKRQIPRAGSATRRKLAGRVSNKCKKARLVIVPEIINACCKRSNPLKYAENFQPMSARPDICSKKKLRCKLKKIKLIEKLPVSCRTKTPNRAAWLKKAELAFSPTKQPSNSKKEPLTQKLAAIVKQIHPGMLLQSQSNDKINEFNQKKNSEK